MRINAPCQQLPLPCRGAVAGGWIDQVVNAETLEAYSTVLDVIAFRRRRRNRLLQTPHSTVTDFARLRG